MLSNLWAWLVNYVLSLFAARQTEQAIEKDQTDIATKKVEADVKLKELSDLGVLKTTAGNEAVILTQDVSKADVARKNAVEATDVSMAVVPKESKDINGEELEAKLRDL